MGIRSSEKREQGQPINWQIMSNGILLFLFSLILLAVKQRTFSIFGYEIWEIPSLLYQTIGLIALILSLIFMVAIFYKPLAGRLESLLTGMPKSYWHSFIGWLYWVIVWLVYSVGWLKGLSSISADKPTFHVAFWVGFLWFLVIGFIWVKLVFQKRKK